MTYTEFCKAYGQDVPAWVYYHIEHQWEQSPVETKLMEFVKVLKKTHFVERLLYNRISRMTEGVMYAMHNLPYDSDIYQELFKKANPLDYSLA